MNAIESPKKTNTPNSARLSHILQRLAILNKKLQKIGLADKGERGVLNPFAENPRRHVVRSRL
jgi:hypothetical protein